MLYIMFGSIYKGENVKTYELFKDNELKIAEKIQQRRLQMLIHSYIYYKMNESLVSDSKWTEWALDLKRLQEQYPEIAEKVMLHNYFTDWDGSSGAFLPLNLPWVEQIAKSLVNPKNIVEKPKKETKKKRRLF